MVRVYYSDENFQRLKNAEELGRQKGVSAIQIALAYVLNQPFPTVALVGPANVAELESSYAGSLIELTPEEVAFLDKV
jgi:aryl-alcohol dehydrogenase-like predicted oxidoreductase